MTKAPAGLLSGRGCENPTGTLSNVACPEREVGGGSAGASCSRRVPEKGSKDLRFGSRAFLGLAPVGTSKCKCEQVNIMRSNPDFYLSSLFTPPLCSLSTDFRPMLDLTSESMRTPVRFPIFMNMTSDLISSFQTLTTFPYSCQRSSRECVEKCLLGDRQLPFQSDFLGS